MTNFKELLTLIPFVLAIAILLNLLVFRGVEVVYPQPQYDDYCGSRADKMIEPARLNETAQYSGSQIAAYKNSCELNGGKYEEAGISGQLGYCDQDYTCRQEYDEARESYALVMMFVLIAGGVISILFSRKARNRAVELGLSYGGLFMLVATLGQLWQVGSQVAQLFGIVIALGALVYFVTKKTSFNF